MVVLSPTKKPSASTTVLPIVEPTLDTPWSIDGIGAIPGRIMQHLDAAAGQQQQQPRNDANVGSTTHPAMGHTTTTGIVTTAVSGPWHALCATTTSAMAPSVRSPTPQSRNVVASKNMVNNNNNNYYYEIYVWYAIGTIDEQARTSFIWKLRHEDAAAVLRDSPTPTSSSNHLQNKDFASLLQLSIVSPHPNTAFVYALHPVTCRLLVWRLQYNTSNTSSTTTSSSSNYRKDDGPLPPLAVMEFTRPQAYLVIRTGTTENDDDNNRAGNSEETLISALMVHWTENSASPMILVGTTDGSVYYIKQTKNPVSLQAIRAVPSSSSGTSLIRRLWQTVQYHEPNSAILDLHYISSQEFVSVSEEGQIAVWNITTPTESSSKVLFSISVQLSLLDAIQTNQNVSISDLRVLQVATSVPPSSSTDTTTSMLRCIVLTQHNNIEESRIYVVSLLVDGSSTLSLHSAHWLDRIVDPTSILVEGFCAGNNGTTYAALRQDPSLPIMGMAFAPTTESTDHPWFEFDFPTAVIQSILPNSMVPDIVTHGVTILDSTGMEVRVRVVETPSSLPIMAHGMDQTSHVQPATEAAEVARLVVHLKSSFEAFYRKETLVVKLPRSITNASLPNVEAAIIECASQLALSSTQIFTGSLPGMAPTKNARDAHVAYITMLLHSGIYRELCPVAKWSLLTIGQSICVYTALRALAAASTSTSTWEREQWSQLTYGNLSEWLLRTQTDALSAERGDDCRQVWTLWLVTTLDAAMTYREELCSTLYDIKSVQPPLVSSTDNVPVWTSTPTVQRVLLKQLDYWLTTSKTGVSEEDLRTVIERVLVSLLDSYASCPTSNETRRSYAKAQKNSYQILKSARIRNGDLLLFELATAHHYYDGICQVSFDHCHRRDRDIFSLVPLFKHLAQEEDVDTGITFARFVLTWHANRGYIGHVMEYGQHCPEELEFVLDNYDQLSSMRWIHSAQKGDFAAASNFLLQSTNRPQTKVVEARRSLCVALVNEGVHESESGSPGDAKRRRLIQKKLELVNTQESIARDHKELKDAVLWDPDRLLNFALRKVEKYSDRDRKVDLFVLALAACTANETDSDVRSAALLVWMKAILADAAQWREWVTEAENLTDPMLRKRILSETVFGGLYEHSSEIKEWDDVSFHIIQESDFEQFGKLDALFTAAGLQRLLSSATKRTVN